jgi:hypothetical protein
MVAVSRNAAHSWAREMKKTFGAVQGGNSNSGQRWHPAGSYKRLIINPTPKATSKKPPGEKFRA